FLDQENAYSKWNPKAVGTPDKYGTFIPWCGSVNSRPPPDPPVTAVVVPGLLCPSDGLGGKTSTRPGYSTVNHSNYLAFFGDDNYGAILPTVPPQRRAAFGFNYGASLTDILDGTSNTMVFGEYLTGLREAEFPDDFRGAIWIDLP